MMFPPNDFRQLEAAHASQLSSIIATYEKKIASLTARLAEAQESGHAAALLWNKAEKRLAEAERLLREAVIQGGHDADLNRRIDAFLGAAEPPSAAPCTNCGGTGIIRWQAYDGTEEGHEEQDPCPVCTPDHEEAKP